MPELPRDVPFDVPGLWEGYKDWLDSKGIGSPHVVIHGGYGKNNLGDDAILDVLLTRTLLHFPAAKVTVVCHGPANVAERYRGLANVSACHFKSLDAVRAIVGSDLYFIGGGGIINRINTYSGRDRLRLLDMKGKFLFFAALGAKIFGARTHFYAIGANSFPDAGVKLLARWVLRGADTVSVRDPMSLRNLRELGLNRELVQVLDPALSMTPAPREEAERMLSKWNAASGERPRVCIGFRYVREPTIDNDKKVDAVVLLSRYLIDKGYEVVFLPASQHPSEHFEDDLHFGRQVRQRLGSAEHFSLIEEYHHPRLTMAALGCMDFCVLERLHAVILTSLTGVPFYVVSYDDKVSEFVRLIGGEERLLELPDFMRQTSFAWLEPHLDKVRHQREAR